MRNFEKFWEVVRQNGFGAQFLKMAQDFLAVAFSKSVFFCSSKSWEICQNPLRMFSRRFLKISQNVSKFWEICQNSQEFSAVAFSKSLSLSLSTKNTQKTSLVLSLQRALVHAFINAQTKTNKRTKSCKNNKKAKQKEIRITWFSF